MFDAVDFGILPATRGCFIFAGAKVMKKAG
jgi:hypothetical protein